MKNWTWGDVLLVVGMVVYTIIVCYQNHRLNVQDEVIYRLTQDQKSIMEINKEQTEAILIISNKVDGK